MKIENGKWKIENDVKMGNIVFSWAPFPTINYQLTICMFESYKNLDYLKKSAFPSLNDNL